MGFSRNVALSSSEKRGNKYRPPVKSEICSWTAKTSGSPPETEDEGLATGHTNLLHIAPGGATPPDDWPQPRVRLEATFIVSMGIIDRYPWDWQCEASGIQMKGDHCEVTYLKQHTPLFKSKQ